MLAVVLSLSGPPRQAVALTAAESTLLAAATRVLAFVRAQQVPLSCALEG
jgi:hypothetical protein